MQDMHRIGEVYVKSEKCKTVQFAKLFLDLYICSQNIKICMRMTNFKCRVEVITGKSRWRVSSRSSQRTPIVQIMCFLHWIVGIYYIIMVLFFICRACFFKRERGIWSLCILNYVNDVFVVMRLNQMFCFKSAGS